MSADNLAGRRVVVVGLGLFGGGLGAARWALSRGAEVIVTDLRDAATLARPVTALEAAAAEAPAPAALRLRLGAHDESDLAGADLVVANPAVRPGAPFLRAARGAGARVVTATQLLLERLPCRCIGVTGTNGKTSTVRFIEGLLRASLPATARVAAGGNIGGSLLEDAAAFGPDDVAVLELSSYQLEYLGAATSRPLDVAVVTNIGVDHLDRHGTVARYRAAKLNLFGLLRAGGAAVTDPSVATDEVADRAPSAEVIALAGDGPLVLDDATGAVTLAGEHLGSASDLTVAGDHQRTNLALALAAARRIGASPESLARAIPELSTAAHRLESLGRLRGPGGAFAAWDNGVSTTPESTLVAMRWLEARRSGPAVLLAGGRAKDGQDFGALTEFASQNGWEVVGFGEHGHRLEPGTGPDSGNGARAPRPLEAAVPEAVRRAGGGCLLFSPACASFDAYANFSARADAFREALLRAAEQVEGPTHAGGGPSRIIDGSRATT